MKKIMITACAIVFTLFANAQDNKMAQPAKSTTQETVTPTNDYLVMKGGKIYYRQNNKMTALDKDVTLTNGSIVSVSGDIKMKNGATSKMKEGDFLYMNGNIKSTMKPKKAE